MRSSRTRVSRTRNARGSPANSFPTGSGEPTRRICAGRDFARAASAEHASPFWTARADIDIDAPGDAEAVDPGRDPGVQRAFAAFTAASHIDLTLADDIRFEPRAVIRGREIVVEDALEGGLRFAGNVDLVMLARMACQHRRVPDLFEAYCQQQAPVPLPNLVSGLSLLVARGILHERR